MTASDGRKLKLGDRVMMEGDQRDTGAICEIGYNGVKVKWDDGTHGIYRFGELHDISRHRTPTDIDRGPAFIRS